jgi:hypothetical protein
MKNRIFSTVGQFDRRHVRLVLFVTGLILFVLGAGAPGADGCC